MTDPYAAAWLSEMWPACREIDREERAVDRITAAARNALLVNPQTVDETAESVDGNVA